MSDHIKIYGSSPDEREDTSSVVKLKDTDCAIILKGDGRIELIIPKPATEDSFVADNALIAATLVFASQDQELMEELVSEYFPEPEAGPKDPDFNLN